MNTNPSNYYDLLTFGLGNDPKAFQTFVDRFDSKYNKEQIDGFKWDNEIQLDYTYQQMLVDLNIATLPVYMDADSEALDKQINGFAVGTNTIPTQKHRYGFNSRILREKLLMIQKFGASAMTNEAKNAILDLMFESTDKLYQGNVNARTHQRMQVVSTGQFTISTANNPRGITGITFNFGITPLTATSGTSRWWTNADHKVANQGSASDPLGEMKADLKALRHLGWPAMQVEMSQDLFDDMLTHTKVLEKIGYALYPAADNASGAVAYAGNLSDDALKAAIERIIGAPIKVNDTTARADEFDTVNKCLKTKVVENFKKENVAYVPQGNIGTIKAVQPIVIADDPTARYALADGGRTLISQRYDSKTRSTYIESEGAWLAVPNMPQYMTNKTVTV